MPIYVQIPGVQGDVTEPNHKDWIDASSFQFGVGRAISTPVGSAAKREASAPSVSEISITKEMGESTPKLFEMTCVASQGVLVKIDLLRTGNDQLQTYMSYTLTNCLISGYSVSSGGDSPTESLSLNFTKVELKYTPYDENNAAKSPLAAGYDLASGKKV